MGISKGVTLLGLALLLQYCSGMTEVENSDFVLSLYPPFTEEELVVEPETLGWWEVDTAEEEGEVERFIISNPEGKVLTVCAVEDDGVIPLFFARTTRVNDDLLLVLRPGYRGTFPLSEGEKFLWVPGHALVQIDVLDDHLMARLLLREDFLKSVSKDPENTLKYEDTKERVLITSDGMTLREYLGQEDRWEDMFTPWAAVARRIEADEGACSHLPPPPPPPPPPSADEGTGMKKENPK